jgi:glycosyl transferase family 25
MALRPPIWVISLERAQARRAYVVEGFSTLGIPFEIVDAVDGYELSDAERGRCSQVRALFHVGHRLTQGELGNALSHLEVYARMARDAVPMVVVMEDDALPAPALMTALDQLDRIPADWDVVTFRSQFASSGPVPLPGVTIGGDHQVCTYERVPFGAQCYLVRLDAARRLLDVGYPACMPADELLFRRWPANLRVYGVEPPLAFEGDFESELVRRSAPATTRGYGAALVDQAIVVAGKVWYRVRRSLNPS